MSEIQVVRLKIDGKDWADVVLHSHHLAALAEKDAEIAALREEKNELARLLNLNESGVSAVMAAINGKRQAEAQLARMRKPVSDEDHLAEIAALKAEIENMRTYSHETVRGLVDWRDRRIADLEAENARLQWRPITETDLPKVGDEVGTTSANRIGKIWNIQGVSEYESTRDFHTWKFAGFTMFRPINAPGAK